MSLPQAGARERQPTLKPLKAKLLDLRSRGLSLIGKPEVIFDRIDALYQPGTNDERGLTPKTASLPRYSSPSRKRCVTRVRYPGALIMK